MLADLEWWWWCSNNSSCRSSSSSSSISSSNSITSTSIHCFYSKALISYLHHVWWFSSNLIKTSKVQTKQNKTEQYKVQKAKYSTQHQNMYTYPHVNICASLWIERYEHLLSSSMVCVCEHCALYNVQNGKMQVTIPMYFFYSDEKYWHKMHVMIVHKRKWFFLLLFSIQSSGHHSTLSEWVISVLFLQRRFYYVYAERERMTHCIWDTVCMVRMTKRKKANEIDHNTLANNTNLPDQVQSF